jgi:hypothetical protein
MWLPIKKQMVFNYPIGPAEIYGRQLISVMFDDFLLDQ